VTPQSGCRSIATAHVGVGDGLRLGDAAGDGDGLGLAAGDGLVADPTDGLGLAALGDVQPARDATMRPARSGPWRPAPHRDRRLAIRPPSSRYAGNSKKLTARMT
jgi:hypothetical protein